MFTHRRHVIISAQLRRVTARLARGQELCSAIKGAKTFVTRAIRTSPGLGVGFGPTNLHAEVPVEADEDV